VTNTPAYYVTELIADVKGFIVLNPSVADKTYFFIISSSFVEESEKLDLK